MKHDTLHIISKILLVIGGLNWGIFGIWHVDLIDQIFSGFANIIFVAIGLAALYRIGMWAKSRGK